jgi:hypothetical protein
MGLRLELLDFSARLVQSQTQEVRVDLSLGPDILKFSQASDDRAFTDVRPLDPPLGPCVPPNIGGRKHPAYDARDPVMPMINVVPTFTSLRSEPRFRKLLRRMNLPQN